MVIEEKKIKIIVRFLSFWWGKGKWVNAVQREEKAALAIKTEMGVILLFELLKLVKLGRNGISV